MSVRMKTPVTRTCHECGTQFLSDLPKQKRFYCGEECKASMRRRTLYDAPAERQRRSARLTAANPMAKPGVPEKVSSTLKAIGHRPKVRGGNGKGPTRQEKALAEALGWETQISLPTGAKRGSGLSTHYKIDVGNREHRVAIEIDGRSHNSPVRREQDAKKQAWLESIGWRVLRFTNADVTERLSTCVLAVRSSISTSTSTTTTSPTAS